MLKTSCWYRFHPFYLSFSPGCDLNARECLDGPAAPQQGMLGALIVWWPASFLLQWTMTEGTVHTGSPAKFLTKPTEEWKKFRKMYAIKQIKICAEYRDMLPRPRLCLSGTPGLPPMGLSPVSWQTSLGLGSMSRYSAQILICIIYIHIEFPFTVQYNRCVFHHILMHWINLSTSEFRIVEQYVNASNEITKLSINVFQYQISQSRWQVCITFKPFSV